MPSISSWLLIAAGSKAVAAAAPTVVAAAETARAAARPNGHSASTAGPAREGLAVQVLADGNFSVTLDGALWFDSGDVFVRDGGVQYSARGGSLRVANMTAYSGADALGEFNGTNTTFAIAAGTAQQGGEGGDDVWLHTSIRQYAAGPESSVVFEATLPRGLVGSQEPGAGREAPGLATSFPAFRPPSSAAQAAAVGRRGWVSYDGWDCSNVLGTVSGFGCVNLGPEPFPHVSYGVWDAATLNASAFPRGLEGTGPVAFFTTPDSAAGGGGAAVVASAFSSFMATSSELRLLAPGASPSSGSSNDGGDGGGGTGVSNRHRSSSNDTTFTAAAASPAELSLAYGLTGTFPTIPAGFSYSVVLSHTTGGPEAGRGGGRVPGGIQDNVRAWGAKMQRVHLLAPRVDDFTNTHLGYDTDNGAFYYYNTVQGENYEDTLLDVHRYMERIGVPVRHLQLDSYWYTKGAGNGVKDWTANRTLFPHGFGFLAEQTGYKLTAHNRMWAPDTVYARANGGAYDFHVEDALSMPLEGRFWDDLLRNASEWGLYTYEQDWLYNEFVGLNYTLHNATAADVWLRQMGEAAAANGVTIQYCMLWPRFALQSLLLPAVTQARASGDYKPGNDQWRVGMASLFLDALGLRPTKDSFFSNASFAADSGKMKGRQEPYARLQAAVSSLTTGPVFISDAINTTNVTLVMRACRADGVLLQPDTASAALDANIFARAGLSPAAAATAVAAAVDPSAGEVTVSQTCLQQQQATAPALPCATQLLAADVHTPLTVTPEVLGYRDSPALVVFESNSSSTVHVFDEAHPIQITTAATLFDFTLHHVVPVFPASGWALLGEAAHKWVPIAAQRFQGLVDTTTGFRVNVTGVAGEDVQVSFIHGQLVGKAGASPSTAQCHFAKDGQMELAIAADGTARCA